MESSPKVKLRTGVEIDKDVYDEALPKLDFLYQAPFLLEDMIFACNNSVEYGRRTHPSTVAMLKNTGAMRSDGTVPEEIAALVFALWDGDLDDPGFAPTLLWTEPEPPGDGVPVRDVRFFRP